MTPQRPYRPIVAAFLLAVYTFIAAPVQLWHHHTTIPAFTSYTGSSGTKSDTIANNSLASPEANCPVCSHQYPAYDHAELLQFEASVMVHTAKNGCYSPHLISISSFHLPNKGPPAVC